MIGIMWEEVALAQVCVYVALAESVFSCCVFGHRVGAHVDTVVSYHAPIVLVVVRCWGAFVVIFGLLCVYRCNV